MLKIDLQLFGGRGAASGSSGGKGARRRQTEHPDPWNPPPSLEKQLSKENGVDEMTAYRQVHAVADYSMTDYSDIRRAQYENDVDSDAYKKAEAIERFIEQSPVWDGGELYRGVALPQSSIAHLKVGGRIDMKGMSSWSSDEKIAKSFADKSYDSPVVFRSKGTKKGTSITHLSEFGKTESEVLVSGKATWTIKKISKVGKITYVDVDED